MLWILFVVVDSFRDRKINKAIWRDFVCADDDHYFLLLFKFAGFEFDTCERNTKWNPKTSKIHTNINKQINYYHNHLFYFIFCMDVRISKMYTINVSFSCWLYYYFFRLIIFFLATHKIRRQIKRDRKKKTEWSNADRWMDVNNWRPKKLANIDWRW